MKNTLLNRVLVLVSVLFMVNTFGLVVVQVGAAQVSLPDYIPVDWQTGWAGPVAMPTIEESGLSLSSSVQTVESFSSTPPVGTQVWDWYLYAISAGTPTGTQPYMTLRALSGNVEVWTQDYLWFLPGDPRNDYDYGYALTISDEMCQYLADEFNGVIYPTDTGYFGAPLDRNGTWTIFEQIGYPSYRWEWIETDNPQRVILKVLNIRDTNYYDPTYPYYTIGFYSSTYTKTYYNRNMIHIDAWRWWQRLGLEGTQWFPERPELVNNRPYTYEATVAHEYQHNIHRDYQAAPVSFMNEGCSMYAEILCGYGVSWSHVNSFLGTPDNSLTIWGDQGDINILADYGSSTLWAIYLSDHYGGPAILSRYVKAGIPGIAGINDALAYLGYTETFDDVYHDWRIANLIHTSSVGGVSTPKYDYISIDLGAEADPARTYELKKPLYSWRKGSAFGNTFTILGYDTGVSLLPEYGSDYIKFTGLREALAPVLNFDGDDVAGYAWERVDLDGDGDLEWSSTAAANLIDISIIATVDLTGMATATLTFDTYFDIEPLWDFGFVQVSTDEGAHWTSLEGTYTTYDHDPSALPAIIANLPGYTGFSGAWVSDSMDLTPYVDGSIMLRFRYMTDTAVLYPGWWVDNIAINGAIIDDADTTIAFTPVPPKSETDFIVTIIGVEMDEGMPKYTRVEDMTLDGMTETGIADLTRFMEKGKGTYVLLIVSPNNGPADYMFAVTKNG